MALRSVRLTGAHFAVAWLGGALLLAGLFALAQPSFQWGRFEYDVKQPFSGVLLLQPYPALAIYRQQDSDRFPRYSIYPLVGPGRHAPSRRLVAWENRPVTLQGKLLCNGPLTVIEIDENTIELLRTQDSFPPVDPPSGSEELSLRGEIVDLKSYAGYADPGRGSMIIGPASNSLRGGIPPVFVIRDDAGIDRAMLMTNSRGIALGDELLGKLGLPMEVKGTLRNWGGIPVLEADASAYHSLWPWQ